MDKGAGRSLLLGVRGRSPLGNPNSLSI